MTKPAVGKPHSNRIKPTAILYSGIKVTDVRTVIDAGLTQDICANAHVAITGDIRSCYSADGSVGVAAHVIQERGITECVVPNAIDVPAEREIPEFVVKGPVDVVQRCVKAKRIVGTCHPQTTGVVVVERLIAKGTVIRASCVSLSAESGVVWTTYVATERGTPECVVQDSVDVAKESGKPECVIAVTVDIVCERVDLAVSGLKGAENRAGNDPRPGSDPLAYSVEKISVVCRDQNPIGSPMFVFGQCVSSAQSGWPAAGSAMAG